MAKVLVLVEKARFDLYGRPGQIPGDWEIVYGLNLSDADRLAAAWDADYLYTGSLVDISEELIAGMPNLKLIQAEGVGYERIPLASAAARGIPVCNCAGSNAGAVADQAVLLILAVQRFLVDSQNAVFEDRYLQTKRRVMLEDMAELCDCHVGLVGLGRIAEETAKRLRPFGCRISYWSRTRKPEQESQLSIDYLPLDDLIACCDVVSLHTAATPETWHLMDAAALSRMKQGAILINTARGSLVDETALAEELESGHLGGAGLDVQAQEPMHPDNPLLHLSPDAARRLILSPHIGGVTGSAFRRQIEMSWHNLRRVEAGERPVDIVNGV